MSSASATGQDADELQQLREDVDRLARERADLLRRITDLEQHTENLEAKIDVLEDRAPSPGRKEYDQMDREDKATVVAQKLKDTAEATNGRAAMQYKDIVAVFDGRPSAGHAYDIMDTAKEREDITLGTTPDGEKRLTYSVND